MHVFLLLAVPLAYIYLLVLRDQSGQSSAFTAISALKGALGYLIVLVPLFAMNRFVVQPFTGPGLYFYPAAYDFIIPGGLGLLLYLWFTREVGGLAPDERFVSFASFLAGALTVAGVMDLFVRAEYTGAYELFHLPALRIALMLLMPTFLYHYSGETLWLRYLYLFAMLATPFALGAVPLLFLMNYHVAAAALAAVLFLLGWAGALFWVAGGPSLRVR